MNKCQREREECLRNDPRPKDSAQSSTEEYCNARNPISLTFKGMLHAGSRMDGSDHC